MGSCPLSKGMNEILNLVWKLTITMTESDIEKNMIQKYLTDGM
jgi:hypothetical protein